MAAQLFFVQLGREVFFGESVSASAMAWRRFFREKRLSGLDKKRKKVRVEISFLKSVAV